MTMKTRNCPICHKKMMNVLEIVKNAKKKIKSKKKLKLYNNPLFSDKFYSMYIDQGLPTQRRYDFYECLGCGLILLFNEEKIK